MTDQSDSTPTDEFYGNLWWRPDGAGKLRAATLGECAGERQRLRAEVDNLRRALARVLTGDLENTEAWKVARDALGPV
jgi:hypothetical protein